MKSVCAKSSFLIRTPPLLQKKTPPSVDEVAPSKEVGVSPCTQPGPVPQINTLYSWPQVGPRRGALVIVT